nr:protein maelstrom homolog [Leptinotarsa decemlineata]
MPPKKKQTSGNAFFHFMQDFKNRQGRHFKNMQEVAEAASPHWNRMSKEQRKPYEEMALMAKNNLRGGKFTSDGLDIEVLENIEKEEQAKIQQMKNDINYIWKVASSNGRIADELIFIIHINIFVHCTSEDRHYPAEIAIACFNLEDGVLPQNVFHRIIKPGMLPLGYASDANAHSKKTHQLRPPMAGEDDNNIKEVFEEMKHFLSNKLSGSRRMPILYTTERNMKMIQHVLDTWCYDYDEDTPLFKVYSLEYMFRILRNTVAGDDVWTTDTFSTREIEKDVYSFARGICCEYHEVTNVPLYCSRSICVRQAFNICDNCCSDLRITLLPGVHLPDAALTTVRRGSSRTASSAPSISSQSSKYTNLKQSTRDDDSESVISFSSKSEWDNQSLISETSTSATLDSEANFPSLGARKKVTSSPFNNFSSNDLNSSHSNTSSVKSYAGAMGTSGLSKRAMDMPSSFTNTERNFESSKSSDYAPARGRGGRNFNDDASDFPALGRGRGLGLGRSRRVNNTE